MALHLNLYHEIQKQKLQSRRDPLKIGMYGLGAVALCLAGYYFMRLEEASVVIRHLEQMQAEWEKIEPQQKAAAAKAADFSKAIQTSDALVSRIENRIYWAPLLDELLQATPKNVQITKFDGESINDKIDSCSITIMGLSSGAEPRRVAEDLRTALRKKFAENHSKVTAIFQTLEDAPETVVMEGRNMPVANFGIKLDMVEKEQKPLAENTAPVKTRTPR